MQSSRQIVVVGICRSGSSLTAALLQLLGVHMGSFFGRYTKAEAVRHSPTDVFEDRDFLRCNQAMLREAGATTLTMASPEAYVEATSQYAAMKELIAERNSRYSLWGWKDPRTLAVLQHWKKFLARPLYIITERSDSAVLRSLAHQGHSSADVLETVRRYAELARELLAGPERCIVARYELAVAKPDLYVNWLSEAIGVPMRQEAVKYIDRSKDHSGQEQKRRAR